jgi:hypothetical protein
VEKTRIRITHRYSRSDPRGSFPQRQGNPDLSLNRLGLFWRPIIDLTPTDLAPLRLRMITPVVELLASDDPPPHQWFARIGVAGLRHQVLRHAGLEQYDCREPTDLPEHLATPAWNRLTDLIAHFATLDDSTRALLIFHLAQLSYCQYALTLAGHPTATGDPEHDWYVFETGRVAARSPGLTSQALSLFHELAVSAGDPRLSMSACLQGISQAIRRAQDQDLAREFERLGRSITHLPDEWHSWLVRSRFHRAVALLRMTEGRFTQMDQELKIAFEFGARLFERPLQGNDHLVAMENRLILLESRVKAASRGAVDDSPQELMEMVEELRQIDPTCVEVTLVVGDGNLAAGNVAAAAEWYSRVGQLETTAGAIGWFRAGQCYDLLGDRPAAVMAMARCLELDATAIEPRQYLERQGSGGHHG